MLKNSKGMTLVEMIVTIAVFSIAALVLAAGFSTVIRYMGEASAIKNTSNEVYSIIESENSKDVNYEEVYFKIQLSDGNNVDNKVNRVVAEKGISNDKDAYKIKFSKFIIEKNYVDVALVFHKEVQKTMEYLLKYKSESIRKYNETLAKLKEQNVDSVSSFTSFTDWPSLTNDIFINYFFVANQLGESYPKLNQEIVDECNNVFDETKGLLNKDKTQSVRIGNKRMYMKFIYVPDNQNRSMVFLVADEYPYTPKVNQWRTRLVYNHEEECWYYKIHTATKEDQYSDTNYYLNVASLDTYKEWYDLVNLEFKDKSKWRKIELNK